MSARILVVGAGAIGGITAAHLTCAGGDVTVLDAAAEHVASLRSPGLLFDHLGTEHLVPMKAVTSPAELQGRFDFALLTLKSGGLVKAVPGLVDLDLVDTYVCLGNGLVQSLAEELIGSDRLIVGVVEWGATNIGPGHLAQTTDAPFVIGEPNGDISDRVQQLAEVLGSAAQVDITKNITGRVWSKLLLNSTYSGLGAVTGGPYRDVAADAFSRAVSLRIWAEGYDAAVAAGVEVEPLLDIDPVRLVVRTNADEARASDALDAIVVTLGNTKASMLQDLEKGLLTEVDVINGGVVATAEAHGFPAPGNSEIVRLVHEFENGQGKPGPEALGRVGEALGVRRRP
ncbi:MAG: 2-dehydropantoate 2-reductase [Salinibacterium sp.]|nr:2-dehydropantoate 2-reductase [Salinibacterium sp.]